MSNNESIISQTPSSIYLMHKYWGKKPSKELREIIEKYTKENDLILDPFSGFGGIGIESILLNRNIILNDLNPIANFISKNIIECDIDIKKLKNILSSLKNSYLSFEKKWYIYKDCKIIAILRDKDDVPLMLKVQSQNGSIYSELTLNEQERDAFLKEEKEFEIKTWYPNKLLIKNSRISAKENTRIGDLFPKRALICHSYLFDLISKLDESKEKELIKMAFTANLANCSKLVPPISSRGRFAPGAWMTGFYIPNEYIENNVFHYFENRVKKVVKGKADLLKIKSETQQIGKFKITNNDAKNLKLEDNSIDFVFTDFPYGDTVPYFEQSQLWNAWLKYNVDYENEIVVSDSGERNKTIDKYANDIDLAIAEIHRVLKPGALFVFTFHSLNGKEWTAISNSMAKNGFEFLDSKLLSQKTYTPRQLNRQNTIKGDMLVQYRKQTNKSLDNVENIQQILSDELKSNCIPTKRYETNDLIVMCVNKMLSLNSSVDEVDFISVIKNNFDIDRELWRCRYEL
ncbi:MAG: hypothetical protein IKW64_05710 [Clostridia bacterium]|nr:hypothetical protein [Clostridia bacterium]